MDLVGFKALYQAVQHGLPLAVLAQLLPQLGKKHSSDHPPPDRAHGDGIIYVHTAKHAGHFGPKRAGRTRWRLSRWLVAGIYLSAHPALREFGPRSGYQR